MRQQKLFKSFFLGGFECADHINRYGNRVNLLRETEHDVRVREDYRLITALGMQTVREGICWSEVEKQPGIFDFSEVLNRMRAAEEFGIQQIWDLVHFGYPDGLFPTHPQFARRFQDLCRAFARFYSENCGEPLLVVPVNEISFLSWYSGEARGTVPFALHNGWDIKYHLCAAVLRGIQILKEELPDCRIVMVEPLIRVHPCEEHQDVCERNNHQFEAMDIIGGRLCPELGGQEDYLEILGFNYYWNCQWQGADRSLPWPDPEQLRIPLHLLLREAYERYGKPVFLSETGHFGSGRVDWLEEITSECLLAEEQGVDFHGICIYPVTDRPDWDHLDVYPQCGLFDLDREKNRIPEQPYINSLLKQQECLRQRLAEVTTLHKH